MNTPLAAFAPLHLSDATRADSAGPGSGAGFAEVVVCVHALACAFAPLRCHPRGQRWPCPSPSSCVIGADLPGGSGAGPVPVPPPAWSALACQVGAALALRLWVVTVRALASRVESAAHVLLFSVQEPISQFSRSLQEQRAAPIDWNKFHPKTEAEVRAGYCNGLMPVEYVYPVHYDKLQCPPPSFDDSYFYVCCFTDGKLWLPGYEVMEQEYLRQLGGPSVVPPLLWKHGAVAYQAPGLQQFLSEGKVLNVYRDQ